MSYSNEGHMMWDSCWHCLDSCYLIQIVTHVLSPNEVDGWVDDAHVVAPG